MADCSDAGLGEAYLEIRKDANPTNWILFGYEGNNKIVLQGKGEGGLSELVDKFDDEQAQYAYLRVVSGDSESKRTKFVFISWCGASVGALKRAKMSVHKADVKKVLKDYAVELHATSKEDLSDEVVMTRVKKAGGADYSGNTSTQQ